MFLSFRRAFTGGPVRNRPSRGEGGGSGANTKTNIARALKGPKKPKTAAELDQELDAFMGDADVVPPGDGATSAAGDVDMVWTVFLFFSQYVYSIFFSVLITCLFVNTSSLLDSQTNRAAFWYTMNIEWQIAFGMLYKILEW